MGSQEFKHSQQRLVEAGAHDFLQHILEKSHASIDEWQTQMQLKPMSLGTIHMYSDRLPPSAHRLTGVHLIDSVDEAIIQSLARHSSDTIAIIPEGPYVVPFYRPAVLAPL